MVSDKAVERLVHELLMYLRRRDELLLAELKRLNERVDELGDILLDIAEGAGWL